MQISLYTDKDVMREQGLEKHTPEAYRSPYRRDYARLIHAPSFRRLQGKTQLFPGLESDFFRNRLTHSLEVAQIAESIVYKLNYDIREAGTYAEFSLDADLVRFASLAHDLGHPPFGHLGEEVLNERMAEVGGFEGNAQTLHILTKLEKRARRDMQEGIENDDNRLGLDLTMRTLASILKYDSEIPLDQHPTAEAEETPGKRIKIEPKKGYYACDSYIVERIKSHVAPEYVGKFKSVECAIMDVADDIAYSTYDLEDALKGGFITVLDILATPGSWWDRIVEKVNENLAKEHAAFGFEGEAPCTDVDEAIQLTNDLFDDYLFENGDTIEGGRTGEIKFIVDAYATAKVLAQNNFLRTDLTSYLVNRFIKEVNIKINEKHPALSIVYLSPGERKMVEILKRLNWEYIIRNHKLKIVAYRGTEIVGKLFDAFNSADGHELLPEDFQALYNSFTDPIKQKRVICDFIAGMTDKYAIEFYGRLTSEKPETIYKPV